MGNNFSKKLVKHIKESRLNHAQLFRLFKKSIEPMDIVWLLKNDKELEKNDQFIEWIKEQNYDISYFLGYAGENLTIHKYISEKLKSLSLLDATKYADLIIGSFLFSVKNINDSNIKLEILKLYRPYILFSRITSHGEIDLNDLNEENKKYYEDKKQKADIIFKKDIYTNEELQELAKKAGYDERYEIFHMLDTYKGENIEFAIDLFSNFLQDLSVLLLSHPYVTGEYALKKLNEFNNPGRSNLFGKSDELDRYIIANNNPDELLAYAFFNDITEKKTLDCITTYDFKYPGDYFALLIKNFNYNNDLEYLQTKLEDIENQKGIDYILQGMKETQWETPEEFYSCYFAIAEKKPQVLENLINYFNIDFILKKYKGQNEHLIKRVLEKKETIAYDEKEQYIKLLGVLHDEKFVMQELQKRNIEIYDCLDCIENFNAIKVLIKFFIEKYGLISVINNMRRDLLKLVLNNIPDNIPEEEIVQVIFSVVHILEPDCVIELIKKYNFNYDTIQYMRRNFPIDERLDNLIENNYKNYLLLDRYYGKDENYIISLLKTIDIVHNPSYIKFCEGSNKIFNYLINEYGINFIFENYKGNNEEFIKSIFTKISLNEDNEKKYLSLLSRVNDNEYVLTKLKSYKFNQDIIQNFITELCNISPEVAELLINNFGANILLNYQGMDLFALRMKFNCFLGEELTNSLTDDDVKSLASKNMSMVFENKEKFISFYKSLQNNPNISQAVDFFCLYPLISTYLAKNEIAKEDISELEEVLNKCLWFCCKYFDRTKLPEEIRDILSDLDVFLDATGKINTLELNPVVSFDFIKYIYRNLGLDFSIKLSKYNTSSAETLIELIKNNEIDLIKFYIELYEKYNLFEENDKKENIAFLNFFSFKSLLEDIKNKNLQLNENDIKNLKKIIFNKNKYRIKSVDDLLNYKNTIEIYINELLESEDLDYIKENIAECFCNSYYDLIKQFYGYELCNFSKIIDVSKTINQEALNKLKLIPKEIKLIIFLKNIINCQNIEKLKMLLNGLISNGEILDYRNDFHNIINKIRNIYGMSFNSILTDINNLNSPRDTNSIPGVTIIDLNGERFNFYVHRLFHFDAKFSSYAQMLEDDPSLWTKLEGASTLSTSCISDKGLHFLHNNDPNGVVYLFNNIPNDSMLFMYGRDLCVQHGGHQLEPTSGENKFTDFESLIQATNYHGSYNELAVFREGIMPCAFACIGEVPNEATIKAAKYFSEILKVDIPIIKLNSEIYRKQNAENKERARQNFAIKANLSNLKDIFYDGTGIIEEKVEFCLNELKTQYKKGIIDYKEYIYLLSMMQKFIDVTYDKQDTKNLKRKVQLLRQSICILNNLTEQEIVEIETANLGESGIMYKMSTEDKKYLLKPSVEKVTLKNEPFRAEIQKSASTLQTIISPNTSVGVDVISEGPLRIARQELISVSETKKNILNSWFNSGVYLEPCYIKQLLQEYVVDFLLCNFDCYSGNFIVDSNNNIRGIDKEQSFRFIQDSNTLDPSFSYNPNGSQRVPIYFKLFEEYKLGNIDLDLNIIKECIKKVEAISDDDYIKIFEKYAESLDSENKQSILQMILERKKVCTQILKDYVIELQNSRNGGVKL